MNIRHRVEGLQHTIELAIQNETILTGIGSDVGAAFGDSLSKINSLITDLGNRTNSLQLLQSELLKWYMTLPSIPTEVSFEVLDEVIDCPTCKRSIARNFLQGTVSGLCCIVCCPISELPYRRDMEAIKAFLKDNYSDRYTQLRKEFIVECSECGKRVASRYRHNSGCIYCAPEDSLKVRNDFEVCMELRKNG